MARLPKPIRPGLAPPPTSEIDGAQADRPALKTVYLSRPERDRLDRKIGARIAEIGGDAFRPRDPQDGPPHPRNRWIFPSVAYSRAGNFTRDFMAAIEGVDRSNLRLVTLSLGTAKPLPGSLASHLKEISKSANGVIAYLARIGLAAPQLSAIHLRYDDVSGRLDPHVHAVWDVSPAQIGKVKKLLKKYFSGVWIDETPIEKLRSVVFYITSGIVDHEGVPSWPQAALREVWNLPTRIRFVRPSGHFVRLAPKRAAVDTLAVPSRGVRNRAEPPKPRGAIPGAIQPKIGAHTVSEGHASATSSANSAPRAVTNTSSASPPAQESSKPGNAASRSFVSSPDPPAGVNDVLALLIALAKSEDPL
jgi:hypothetical protein